MISQSVYVIVLPRGSCNPLRRRTRVTGNGRGSTSDVHYDDPLASVFCLLYIRLFPWKSHAHTSPAVTTYHPPTRMVTVVNSGKSLGFRTSCKYNFGCRRTTVRNRSPTNDRDPVSSGPESENGVIYTPGDRSVFVRFVENNAESTQMESCLYRPNRGGGGRNFLAHNREWGGKWRI